MDDLEDDEEIDRVSAFALNVSRGSSVGTEERPRPRLRGAKSNQDTLSEQDWKRRGKSKHLGPRRPGIGRARKTGVCRSGQPRLADPAETTSTVEVLFLYVKRWSSYLFVLGPRRTQKRRLLTFDSHSWQRCNWSSIVQFFSSNLDKQFEFWNSPGSSIAGNIKFTTFLSAFVLRSVRELFLLELSTRRRAAAALQHCSSSQHLGPPSGASWAAEIGMRLSHGRPSMQRRRRESRDQEKGRRERQTRSFNLHLK